MMMSGFVTFMASGKPGMPGIRVACKRLRGEKDDADQLT